MPTSNEEILEAVNKLAVRQQRIERVLIGDKEFEVKGLCEDVKEMKEYLAKERMRKAKERGVVIGGAAAAGGGTVGLIEWLKSVFT